MNQLVNTQREQTSASGARCQAKPRPNEQRHVLTAVLLPDYIVSEDEGSHGRWWADDSGPQSKPVHKVLYNFLGLVIYAIGDTAMEGSWVDGAFLR